MAGITNLILLLQPEKKDIDNESYLDNTPSYSIECVHDIRMVRPPETPGNEDFIKLASYRSHSLLMGRGILRVLRPGTCKQDRFHRKRRSFQPDAAQDHPGSDITDRLHSTRDCNVQRTDTPMESFCCILLSYHGRILRIFEIKVHFFRKTPRKIWK